MLESGKWKRPSVKGEWRACDFGKTRRGRLYTDEQLLRHIAHYGSLGAALAYGDIRLVSESPQLSRARPGERPRLADYLEEA